jgi:hypothetical protein
MARPREEWDKLGRPSRYLKEFCDDIIRTCSEGHSISGWCGKIGISRNTAYYWTQKHPEFAEATRIAKAAACYRVECDANRIRRDGGGSAAMVQFQLKNFASSDYVDKQEHALTGKDGAPIEVANVSAVDFLRSQIEAATARLGNETKANDDSDKAIAPSLPEIEAPE